MRLGYCWRHAARRNTAAACLWNDSFVCLFVQRNFGASRCSVCGMVYSKGHEEDEKLHKAYHQGAVQGFKFQVGGSN